MLVVGARPNFLKVAPLHKELASHVDSVEKVLVHTGQHYDYLMSEAFFEDLELPKPDFHLGVGSGSHTVQTARIMIGFEKVVCGSRPDLVVVFGDVNSTLACSLVCAKERIPLAHIEAGLRSFDRSMPEEINRLLTDQVSDSLFVTEQAGVSNLLMEGIPREKIFLVGNIMIDSLVQNEQKIMGSKTLERLGLVPKTYFLMTVHRSANVDSAERLLQILNIVKAVTTRGRMIFPVHPRTAKNLEHFGLQETFRSLPNLSLIEPLGYLEFLCLVRNSGLVLSDSGGIQTETSFLGVPCLTLRETTEQPSTIEFGTNVLVGLNTERVLAALDSVLSGRSNKNTTIPLWDGKTAERIARTIIKS